MAGTITPGGSALNLLETTYRPELATQCNEEMRIANDFDNGNDGLSKFGNLLTIRKILRIAASTLSASDTGKSLTYTNNTELAVTVSPTFAYGAVEIARTVLSRLLAEAKLRAAYRKQIGAGLATKIDADAGVLAGSLTTNVKGSGAVNIDKTLLLDGVGALVETCRDLYNPGQGKWAHFKFHPKQIKHVLAINEITNAQIRGDAEKPVKTGWVWDAYGLQMMESGSVYTAAGVAHNLLHIKEAFVLAYNTRPDFLTPQEFELAWRLIAFVEYGVGEVWDEYAVDMQTSSS
jgi:hypothetical protein